MRIRPWRNRVDARSRRDLAGDAEEFVALMTVVESRQEELLGAAVPIGERLYAESPKRFVTRLRAYWHAWRPE